MDNSMRIVCTSDGNDVIFGGHGIMEINEQTKGIACRRRIDRHSAARVGFENCTASTFNLVCSMHQTVSAHVCSKRKRIKRKKRMCTLDSLAERSREIRDLPPSRFPFDRTASYRSGPGCSSVRVAFRRQRNERGRNGNGTSRAFV